MLRSSSLLVATVTALMPLLAAAQARAQEAAPTAIVVVDGSGSMWGNLGTDKRPKIEMVREALRALLPSLRTDARVGLSSFGHRRRGNCGDAEVIVPPEPDSAVRMSVPLDKINAMGKAPIALALRESATAIAGASPASIVLIFDDLDNCGQDICAVAERHAAKPGARRAQRRPRPRQATAGADQLRGTTYRRQAVGRAGRRRLRRRARTCGQPRQPASRRARQRRTRRKASRPAGKPDPGAPPGLYLSAGLGEQSATLESPVRWRISRSAPTAS